MSILPVLIAVLIVATSIVGFAIARSRFKMSLRGLLGFVTAVAILLSVSLGYRRASMAQMEWLAPNSNAAQSLHPQAEITTGENRRFQFDYSSRNTSIEHLTPVLNAMGNGGWSLLPIGTDSVRVYNKDRQVLEDNLQRLRTNDTLTSGSFVIRGRVEDRSGNPLSGANIDVLGRFVFINCFKTREDGTFTMPLSDENASFPAGDGYYFRIRTSDETKHWHSAYFSISEDKPELVVDIVVPK